jgi:hypothetical protein
MARSQRFNHLPRPDRRRRQAARADAALGAKIELDQCADPPAGISSIRRLDSHAREQESSVQVQDAMTQGVIGIQSGATIGEAIELMLPATT